MSWIPQRVSPGFERMKKRLGPDATEQLRLDTLRLQEEALEKAKPAKPPIPKPAKASDQSARDTIRGKRT